MRLWPDYHCHRGVSGKGRKNSANGGLSYLGGVTHFEVERTNITHALELDTLRVSAGYSEYIALSDKQRVSVWGLDLKCQGMPPQRIRIAPDLRCNSVTVSIILF